MPSQVVSRRGAIRFAVPLVGGLAVWNNLVVPRLPAVPGSYVAANCAAAAAVLAAARRTGLSWEEMGLSRRCVPAGLRDGGACAVLVAAGYATALAVPSLRPLLADARVAGHDAADLAYHALVRIPLGTVLWEEVAFRGVLLAVSARLLSPPAAVGGTSILFGVWHIRPTLDGLAANDLVRGPVPSAVAVTLACLGTTAAGLLFTALRLRSGSLFAPVLLHLGTNVLGLLAAAAAIRLSSTPPRGGAIGWVPHPFRCG